MEAIHIPGYTKYRGTFLGTVINRKNQVIKYTKRKDGESVVRLIHDKTGEKRTLVVSELLACLFLGEPPFPNAKVCRKNGNMDDYKVSNLEWVEDNHDFNERNDEDKGKGEANEDDESDEEDIEIPQLTEKALPPHGPIFEVFVESDEEFDLKDGIIDDENISWKIYRDIKGNLYNDWEISEYGIYRNFNTKIVKIPTISKNGYQQHKIKRKTVLVIDMVASTFLKIPENAIMVVHKSFNLEKREKKKKYEGQSNHYKNLKWLTKNDIAEIPIENYFISRYGDFYSFNFGRYNLLCENETDNGLKFYDIISDGKKKRFKIHKSVGEYFVKRLDKSYKYAFHKNGNLSNNHSRNIVWVNTLAGIHNDGMRYYLIPGCSKNVLGDDDQLYSFQKGILKLQKGNKRSDGYIRVFLTDSKGIQKGPLLHTLVGKVHLAYVKDKNLIDHIDRDRGNFKRSNLRWVNTSENGKNSNRKPSKCKRIMQYNMQGDLLRIFSGAKEIQKELNISVQKIRKCCSRNKGSEIFPHKSENFRWKYCESDKYVIRKDENFKPVVVDFYNLNALEYLLSDEGVLLDPDGYRKSVWGDDGCYKECKILGQNYYIFILVALLFVEGRTNDKNQVNHKDEDLNNNKASNLEWVTQSENIKHSIYRQYIPVEQIDIETLEVIKIFPSRSDAGEAMTGNRHDGSSIGQATKKPLKTKAYGFYWRNVTINDEENEISEENKNK